MKVYELINILGDFPANAEVICSNVEGDDPYSGTIDGVEGNGNKANDGPVNIYFTVKPE